ncbi:MAG: hypothetical protein JOZ46_05660 [Candidatus Dormibacteraeota bacterium]|nr:hypothetical protein [Candidatus Dormibacteraeota bacterium]MBV9525284.1 hypothetical protein [Candidatus Dormibacteraeota bacterium]
MVAVIVMAAVLAVMVALFLWFYFYSRTLAWGDSETRNAVLRVLMVVGPIFGMHYRPPRPEPPTISTPGGTQEPTVPGLSVPPAPGQNDAS